MAKTLTIDRGNTTTKVAIWASEESTMPLTSWTISDATTADIVEAADVHQVEKAILCSVAGPFDGLRENLEERGISLMTLKGDTRLPITLGYATPASLGVDRIAAVAGARAAYPDREVLIVDIGTAVTYDLLTREGHFVGGNIAPGIGMRLRALHKFTSALPQVSSNGDYTLWGGTTETAMRSGAINGVIAEICYYRSQLSDDTITMLTGGWAADIAKALPFEAKVNPLLVLQGLNSIINYNEDI